MSADKSDLLTTVSHELRTPLTSILAFADSFGPILQEKNQTLNVMIEDSSIEMFADQIRLTQVVSNLLTNVSKYSAEGTEVNISVEADNYEVVVEVTDQGIVIDVL